METVFILTLGFDPVAFTRLDALRRAHFPPERNFIPAHLSLFHHLQGDLAPALARATDRPPIPLRFTRVHRLGRGTAYAVDSPELQALHAELARAFADQLTPQDRQRLRPHVTIQNKADPDAARATLEQLTAAFAPWEATGVSLLLWRYLGGPWELAAEFPFASSDTFATFTEWNGATDAGAYRPLSQAD